MRLAEENSDGLTITVSDRGIGIPPEDLPRIFDRFHRSANSAEQKRGSALRSGKRRRDAANQA